ncbi:hypothetical protein BCY91_10945 [Pelobium manganitolerans]|uniref:Glycosyl hydrolase family 30 TIM-barrel domain-containing protein n=1 Tax=Pelobium manganitolerans TaxID=1842495 RepID=A0A419S2W0_9SPHI|nr:hypothetical protein [Pelobium manganitolerans]RKD13316.1 hypothetical protein BCY91_10945 [Pelobium manganitolerans]
MKRNLYLFFAFILVFIACKKEEKAKKDSAAIFSVKAITIPVQAGKAEFTIKWSYAEWEISTDPTGFISGFTYLKGGSSDHSSTTKVNFNYLANNTIVERKQDIILTNKTTGAKTTLTVTQEAPMPVKVSIDSSIEYQEIDGFGFSSAWCGTLSAAKNNSLYNTLGFSLLRIRVDQNKNNWGEEIANSAAAHAAGAKVLGSEWSPPVAWNSNGKSTGGYLLPQYYADYANYLKEAANTIKLDYVSFQNEPDMGAIDPSGVVSWTESQMRTFLIDHSATIGKPIVYAESFSFNDAYTDPALNDASVASKIAIIGGHLYGGGLYTHQNALDKRKKIWQTEHYVANSRDNINNALIQAKEMQDCMNHQMSAYFYWWVNDNDASVNLVNQSGAIYKAGYVAGQFAKWITPGKVRIAASYNPSPDTYVTAYAKGGIVVVAVNNGDTPVSHLFSFSNVSGLSTMEVNRTSATEDMDYKGTVKLSNNAFSYTLPAKSVTTFHQY